MEGVRQYVLSVLTTALICGLLTAILPAGAGKNVLKLLCGLALTVTVLSPLAHIRLEALPELLLPDMEAAGDRTAQGQAQAQGAMAAIIKSKTEAYIQDKAKALNADLRAEVLVSGNEIPVPIGAVLRGTVTPWARRQLEAILEEDLGIPKEEQQWTT